MKARKILVSVAALALVAALSIGGTLAYLTSQTKVVKNTFTVGNVNITLDEAAVNPDGTEKFDKDGNQLPRTLENSYNLLPGHTYLKDPTIHVNSTTDCFIRAKVTLTNAKEWVAIATKYADNKVENIITGTDDNIWWVSQPDFDETANTVTYTFIYKNENHADELSKRIWTSTDSKDLVLFKEIVMPEDMTNDELQGVDDTKITVIAEAIQADGFDSADAAWSAFVNQTANKG